MGLQDYLQKSNRSDTFLIGLWCRSYHAYRIHCAYSTHRKFHRDGGPRSLGRATHAINGAQRGQILGWIPSASLEGKRESIARSTHQAAHV